MIRINRLVLLNSLIKIGNSKMNHSRHVNVMTKIVIIAPEKFLPFKQK